MKKQLMTLLLAAGLAGAVSAIPVFGQAAPGAAGGTGAADGNNGGGGRGRRNFDPAQFRQRMQDQMKTDMAATDDEWKVLQPKIEKVQEMQAATRGGGGGFGGFRGRNRGNQADGAAPEAPPAPAADASPVVKAAYDLRVTLLKKDATPEDIKAKLTALRDAKTKAKDELTKAQNDLRDVASVRQEAVLVQDGLLE